MKKLRSFTLYLLAFALLAAVITKSLTVLASEISFHQYKSTQSILRDRKIAAQDSQVAELWRQTQDAVKWAPKNASAQYEAGRMLHRIALFDENRLANVCQLAGQTPVECEKIRILTKAVAHYDAAVEANKLVGGARFWRLSAEVSIHDLRREAGEKVETLDADELLAGIDQALSFEGANPNVYRAAGYLALRVNASLRAADYFYSALWLSGEGMDKIVDALALTPEGLDLLETAVPDKPALQAQLADVLIKRWNFKQAKLAFDRSKAEEPAPLDPNSPIVTNGHFSLPFGEQFMGWEVQRRPGVTIKTEAGQPGVLIELRNAPKTYFHLKQPIALEGETRYRLSYRIRPEGRLQPDSAVGFEVVHPYDFSIWSACERCIILHRAHGVGCRRHKRDDDGFTTIETEFTTPLGLNLAQLRLNWIGRPGTGQIFIDSVKIEKVEQATEELDDASAAGVDHHSDEK